MPEPKTYTLTDQQHATMLALNQQAAAAKLEVYRLNVQMEQLKAQLGNALKAVEATEQQWSGALAFLSSSNGFQKANLSPDLKTLTETV